jgi:hypothetical protein
LHNGKLNGDAVPREHVQRRPDVRVKLVDGARNEQAELPAPFRAVVNFVVRQVHNN